MTPEQRKIVKAMRQEWIDKVDWHTNHRAESERVRGNVAGYEEHLRQAAAYQVNVDALAALLTAIAEARAEAYKDAARACRELKDVEQMPGCWGDPGRDRYVAAIERAAEAAKGRA